MRQETNIEVAAEPQPVEAKKAEAKKTDEHEDSDDDAAWWRLYRQAMPYEEYSSLTKGQKYSRRKRFQKVVAANRPEKAVQSTLQHLPQGFATELPSQGCGREQAGEGS